jgi:hypothetical protein
VKRGISGVKRADLGAARDSCLGALRELGTAGAGRYAPRPPPTRSYAIANRNSTYERTAPSIPWTLGFVESIR